MDPVGRGDGSASSLAADVYSTKDRAAVCPEKIQIKRLKTHKTPSCFGAQRNEPNDAEKDGDVEMRRDTGLAVGGDRRCLPSYSPFSVVFTTRCRLLPPSFLSLSTRDASPSLPSSVLRSAPGVTPFRS